MPSSPGLEEPSVKELFSSIRYIMASSLRVERADQLRHVLDTNGAIFLEKGLSDPSLNTVITNSNRFEGWEDVAQRDVRVVSEKWVERSVILGKMQPSQYFSPDPSMLFSGIVACASDLPVTDLEVLSAGITGLGGQWRTGLTRDVTHLFALTPDSLKYSTAIHYRDETGIRVVLPHWFDDAVRLGMGNLPTKPYEWPDPQLLKGADDLISEKVNVKAKGKAALAELERNDVKRNMYATAVIFTPTVGQSSPPNETDISLVLNKIPGPTNGAPGLNLNHVWKGRKFVLSRTLELYKGRREAVQAGIERAGGVVLRFEGDSDEPEPSTDQRRQGGEKLTQKERVRRRNEAQRVADCDILVTRWRHGRAYVRAYQGGKIVGTLAWLFHVQSSGVLSNPQDQLLHYPVPKRSIEAFSSHVITVTNYTGEAREYIKKLISAMGATFTPSMSGENTALIAAYLGGTKAEKAQSWSIPIVNHTWLEDCFVQWRNLTMALEKYIVFPHGVDFSSLLGERGVGVGNQVMNEVEELTAMTFEEDEDYLSDDPAKAEAAVADADMPNGTEGSVKEVAKGLVDGGEAEAVVPVSDPQSKPHSTKSTTSLQPPDGMDIDFEPPSTAAVVANHMAWNIDVDLDQDVETDARLRSPDDDDREGNESATVASRSASPQIGSRKVLRKVRQDEDTEDKEVHIRKKTKARTVTKEDKDEHEDEDEEQILVSKKSVKIKSKVGKPVEEIIELDSEDDVPKKRAKGKGKRRRNVVSSHEEEEAESVDDETRAESKRTTNLKSKSASTSRSIGGGRAKTSSKPKAKAMAVPPVVDFDDDEDEALAPKHQKGATTSKSKSSAKKDKGNHETEEESESTTAEKPKTALRRKLTVEVVLRSPPKGKGKEVDLSESKKRKSDLVPVTPANKTAGTRSEGLLKKAKADARTRIKRKSIPKGNVSAESEDEDTAVHQKRTKGLRNKKGEASNDKEERQLNSKTQKATSSGTKPKGSRSKPLRVYSSEDVESEDDEPSSEVTDADVSDEDLPETINLPSGSRTKTRENLQTRATTSTRTATVRSVLSPSLAMSGTKGKEKADHDAEVAVFRSRKSKPKIVAPVSDSEGAVEDEVKETKPRTRSGLARSNSFKAVVGQSSSKDVLNSGQKSKEDKHRRRSHPTSRKVSKVTEPMEVDDDHNSRSSPASASGPSVTVPRRNAAAKASQRLHDTLMPDLVNFEAQMKKAKGKGRQSVGSMNAFALEIEEREPDTGKRKKKVQIEEGSDGSDEEEVQPKKKRRLSDENEGTIKVKRKAKGKQKAREESVEVEGSKTPSGVVLLTTQLTLSDDVLKTLSRLGVCMTTRAGECTHLLCPHLVRTEKFLCALARAPFILSAKWATASAAAKTLLPEKEFMLKDPTGEKKFDINLAQVLQRARANKGNLLEGKLFYLTPRVSVDKKLLKNVVNACGGDITTQQPSVRIIRAAPENRYVISCRDDISMWRSIAVEGYKVYSQELLLAGIMKQQIEWDREEYMIEP